MIIHTLHCCVFNVGFYVGYDTSHVQKNILGSQISWDVKKITELSCQTGNTP